MSDWMQRWNQFKTEAKPYHKHLRVDDFLHSTYISLRNKFFYAEVPKVACSTIKRMLICAEYGEKVDFGDFEFIHYREFTPLLTIRQIGSLDRFFARQDVVKFSFVRNPYTRLLSCYLDKIVGNAGQKNQISIQLGYGDGSDQPISFEEFVDAILVQAPMHMDPHWRIQYDQTFHQGINYDFIGRFERLEEDLRHVISLIGIDFDRYYEVTRPHITGANEKLKQYYTPAIQEKVYQKYKLDFETFGYDENVLAKL